LIEKRGMRRPARPNGPTRSVDFGAFRRIWNERVAQSVEHLTFNQGVLGSSPSALTNKIR
jgi:hypothetical protein